MGKLIIDNTSANIAVIIRPETIKVHPTYKNPSGPRKRDRIAASKRFLPFNVVIILHS